MAEEQNTVQPSSNTGDILGAMQAEQANMSRIYQLELEQVNILLDINTSIGELYSELHTQTSILRDLYSYIARRWGPQEAGNTQASQNTQGNAAGALNQNAQPSLYANEGLTNNVSSHLTQQYIAQNSQQTAQLNEYINAVNQSSSSEEASDRLQVLTSRITGLTEAIGKQKTNLGSGQDIIRGTGEFLGGTAGKATEEVVSKGLTAALTPALGPLAPIVGEAAGKLIGERAEATIEAGFNALATYWGDLEQSNRKIREQMINSSFEKLRQDIRDTSTYALEIYDVSVKQLYSAWDKNLNQVSATMGYTKEAINTLQDSVAQKLLEEGYGFSISAGNYLDELGRVLNANLNSTLAEAFATQSLILEKAVPEIDLTSMAADFGAIYTQAAQQGLDAEATMIDAMNQVAGAVKAIEEITNGNNQFIRQVPAYLQEAQAIVNRAGGSVDNVAALTTQMMAAEGPLAALVPQLSGFTGELVTILTKQNDSTAVALRAIMHDINENVGISATSFMQSFMEDTQGTLVTAFQAIDQFIERNENPAARQEFLQAMESIFGISGDKLSQLDFGYLADQLAQTNAGINTQALIDAENLVKSGETTTLEQQLVDNTANMLLSQNAIRDTLDNALMRKLEVNEIQMERSLRQQAGVQAVDLAESTMSFFVKLKDLIVDLQDPFGLFKIANTLISGVVDSNLQAMNYQMAANWSSISSEVASDAAGIGATYINTTGGAIAALNAEMWGLNAAAINKAVDAFSIAGSTAELYERQQQGITDSINSLEKAAEVQSSTAVGNYENQLQQQRAQEAQDAREGEQQKAQEEAANENRTLALESREREIDNHENLSTLKDEIPELREDVQSFQEAYASAENEHSSALIESVTIFTDTYITGNANVLTALNKQEDNFSSVVAAIAHNKPDVSKLDDIHAGVEKIITYFATYLEFLDNSLQGTDSGLRMSPSDREQITGRGLFY